MSTTSSAGTGTSAPATDELHYDPYTVEKGDPNATYERMREEAPLYRNEERNFWALTRFADVEAAFKDHKTFSSARGNILEVIQADPDIPDAMFINEDPPEHTIHRGLVGRAFTPRRMREIEDKIRAFCVAALEPFEGADRFDFVHDLGKLDTYTLPPTIKYTAHGQMGEHQI